MFSFFSLIINSQVTPNSNRFDIENYIAVNNKGEYSPYTVHGFYENASSVSKAKIFILPILSLDLKKIKFIDRNGNETYQGNENVRTIIIPVSADLSLPNESQKAAIAAAINRNTSIQAFQPQLAKNLAGQPLVNPIVNTNPALYGQIMTMANNYEMNAIIPQQNLINEYNTKYEASIISLAELEIIIEAGGSVIYSKRIPGTTLFTGGRFNNIAVEYPDQYVKNLIANGNGQILFSYKFRDSKKSSINAHLDTTRMIDQFLSDAYKSSVSQSSSGWSFLGLGSSRKSLKTSFDQQVNQQYTDNTISNTTIEMYDADDKMIESFENAFFPELSEKQAIQNHIAAAEKAGQEGNKPLQDLHLKYAEMLENNNPNLTPNIEAAVAALGKKDYVGFIANGVRWGDNKGKSSNSYRSVLNSSEMASMTQNWNQTKIISVQHAVNQPVTTLEEVKFKASLGLIDGIPFQSTLGIYNGYGISPQNINGIILGPVTAGGALQQNNIMPGTLITRIGSYNVFSGQTVRNALSNYNPGDRIYITQLLPPGPNPNIYQEQRVEVTLGAYPEIR